MITQVKHPRRYRPQFQFQIDNIRYPTLSGNTAMQSSLSIGYDVPRFCYHEKLSIAGNCRMCLLEIAYPRSLKPMASCALPLLSNMSIYTNTIMVKKAREGVLELLLINHPLDCPICDQGGECDLQDQTQKYGGDRGRFYEAKRAVEDKECGPIVKTSMNRCIHCTKCVRFCNEICGESSLGVLGRGSSMEIGTYVDENIDSEFSGNLPDICPVGALTSKPYAFRARPWELRSFETVDVVDSMSSRIRVDVRGVEIMRILPSQYEDVNEDWITDRTRFSYEGLRIQRLHSPLVRLSGRLIPTTWETAFYVVGVFLDAFSYNDSTYLSVYLSNRNSVFGLFGDLVDSETLVLLNDFFHEVGSSFVFSQNFSNLDLDFRSSYLLNVSLPVIERADLFIFIGFNVRLELPLLNLRIRKAFLHGNSLVVSFGFLNTLTYQHFQQGNTMNSVFNFLMGKSNVSRCLLESRFPIIFIGSGFSNNLFYGSFFREIYSLAKYSNLFTATDWHGLSFIDSKISSFAARDLSLQYTGLAPVPNLGVSFIYMCGVENIALQNFRTTFNFKVFQGHSGDLVAFSSDVVFPGCTFMEKESLYVNLEGKVQKTKFILNSPSLSRVDWKILVGFRIFFFENFLSSKFNVEKFGNELTSIKNIRLRLLQYSPAFQVSEFLNYYPSHRFMDFLSYFHLSFVFRSYFFLHNFIFTNNSKNLYLNNALTQVSKVLGVCGARFSLKQTNFPKK
jgi:NADH dehydrogenase (ubiquinone) Fe-S protein 1